MTAKRSPLNRPTSSWASLAAETDRRPPARCPAGCRGSSRAGCAVPAGRIASAVLGTGHRVDRSAAPCRRRPRRRAARRHPQARASPASARSRLFGTSIHSGSTTPWRSSSRRSSGSPPPKDLPACAMTATLRHLACAPCGARDERPSAHSAAIPTITPPATSSRVVHAAVHAGERDVHRDQRGDEPDRDPRRAVLDARGQEQREPPVDRDRRRGVARRIARVDRQLLEAVHLRDGAGGSRASSCDTTPTRRQARRAGSRPGASAWRRLRSARPMPAMIGRTTPPAMIEPMSEASVSPLERCRASKRTRLPSSPLTP